MFKSTAARKFVQKSLISGRTAMSYAKPSAVVGTAALGWSITNNRDDEIQTPTTQSPTNPTPFLSFMMKRTLASTEDTTITAQLQSTTSIPTTTEKVEQPPQQSILSQAFIVKPVSTTMSVDSPPTAGSRTKKSPADTHKTKRVMDDGYETVDLPIRVFPNWHPITPDEADQLGLVGQIRYPLEWIADFVRNRADDISYLFTGEMQQILLDPSRYERTYQQKAANIPFNAYYEAIYRGLYDSHDIKLKGNGSVPRWDYSKWLAINPRPQVYLDMAIPDPTNPSETPTTPERIVIQLYYDYMPNSTKNFIGLCDGFIDGDRYLSYNHNLVHRIDKGHAFFAGDVIRRNGTDAMAFNNNGQDWKYMKDEKANLPHDGPGCVVLDNRGPNTNSSHFFISQRAMPELDGQYLVVGHVLEGIESIRKIDQLPVNEIGVPLYPVKILKSGILVKDQVKDDPFYDFKDAIPEMKNDRVPITPDPVTNNPNFVYP